MHRLALMFALVLMFTPDTSMSVADCLLQSGYSNVVQSHPHYTQLRGVQAWEEIDQDALRYGEGLGSHYVQTDTGKRKTSMVTYAGALYVFVYKHPDDPLAYTRTRPGVLDWHGDCMLRLN